MPQLHGYHGRYLRVDVSQGQAEDVPLDPPTLRRYLGGSGLGAALLLAAADPPADALAPEAPLAFVFSPLVGSPLTTTAKFAVVCRSPLTDRFNDSLVSSAFALAGKRAAGDALLLTGRARQPSLLLVDDGKCRLEPAGDLWGLSVTATERALQQKHRGYRAAVIGPAGERGVRYATISHDGRHAGRGGSGAVLGAKNIKAVLVRGERRCSWADNEGLVEYSRRLSEASFGPATAKYRELGTASNLLTFNRLRMLPTRNFQQGSFEGAEQLAPETISASRRRTRASCAACTIGCEHIYQLSPGKGLAEGVRLEYESLFALGSLCAVQNADAVLAAAAKCDDLGLDTISTGGTIAFAMECVERGLLQEPWLRFGDGEALLRAIDLIGRRKNAGDVLAEGSRELARRIGGDAEQFAPHVKGLELPGYEPRAAQSMALGLAVGARGADHNRSGAYEVDFSEQVDRRHLRPEQAHLAVEAEDRAAVMDSLILCKFLRGALQDFYGDAARMLQLTTGWDIDPQELQTIAARIVTARKLYNIRAGWTPEEDTLPLRLLQEPLPDDTRAQLTREQLAQLIRAYNRCRGWDDEGYPGAECLQQLGL